jgi:AAA15 family ATPase/GTPase
MKRLNELLRFADTGLNNLKISQSEVYLGHIHTQDKRLAQTIYEISATHPMFQDGKLLSEEASLPLAEESNGVKTLFTFGGRILKTLREGGIIFVDELETSLHPYLSKVLVMLFQSERINKKNAQLIFTTHDTNLLDRTIFRKDQVWFAEKDEFGVSELYSLQDFPDVREDTPFDKWYLAGKFGGIPDIKSIESLFEDL